MFQSWVRGVLLGACVVAGGFLGCSVDGTYGGGRAGGAGAAGTAGVGGASNAQGGNSNPGGAGGNPTTEGGTSGGSAPAEGGEPGMPDDTCPEGRHRCSDLCVPNDDVNTCGTSCSPCEAPVGGTATCDGTRCGGSCESDDQLCLGECIAASEDCRGSCEEGDCPDDPNGTAVCQDNACAIQCKSGYHSCGSKCVANTSVQTCGTSCSACTAGANADPTCNGTSCGFTCKPDYTGTNCELPRLQAVPLPTGYTAASINGMSDDGSVVVGALFKDSGSDAFRWVIDATTVTVGAISGQASVRATAISGDGLKIYGQADAFAIEWFSTGVPQQMPRSNPDTYWSAASTTGIVAAGSSGSSAILYQGTNGSIPGYTSAAYSSISFMGISGDGLTAVGFAYEDGTQIPIRWTEQAGFTVLPGGEGLAVAISPDGRFVVGSQADQAARWSGATSQTLTKLPNLPGSGWWSTARDVNQDGTLAVGWSAPSAGGFGTATLWKNGNTAQKLVDALTAVGISVTGWEFRDANCVSTNGRIIAGSALRNGVESGFVVRMP